jgi:hypothetical protein
LFNITFKTLLSLFKTILNIISDNVSYYKLLEYQQGYSQAVRQLVLIQSFRGSNPLTPAILFIAYLKN